MGTSFTNLSWNVDVAVIGGGPAGSTVSALIAQQGYHVELFEREHFPRFHIGESLIPETYWVLKRLGMLEKLGKSHFVKKHSVQFVSANGRESAPFYFWDNKPHESSQTWQVVRSEFDLMMLDNAREHGVKAHEGVRVRDVLFEEERAVGVKIQATDGSVQEIRARVVVDASGQTGLLQNKFKLRVWDPVLNKGAIWTYWQGACRDSGRVKARPSSSRPPIDKAGSGTSLSKTTVSVSGWSRRLTIFFRVGLAMNRPIRKKWKVARL